MNNKDQEAVNLLENIRNLQICDGHFDTTGEYSYESLLLFLLEQLKKREEEVRREIVEECKKLKKECPNHGEDNGRPVQCYGYDEMNNSCIDNIISIIEKRV